MVQHVPVQKVVQKEAGWNFKVGKWQMKFRSASWNVPFPFSWNYPSTTRHRHISLIIGWLRLNCKWRWLIWIHFSHTLLVDRFRCHKCNTLTRSWTEKRTCNETIPHFSCIFLHRSAKGVPWWHCIDYLFQSLHVLSTLLLEHPKFDDLCIEVVDIPVVKHRPMFLRMPSSVVWWKRIHHIMHERQWAFWIIGVPWPPAVCRSWHQASQTQLQNKTMTVILILSFVLLVLSVFLWFSRLTIVAVFTLHFHDPSFVKIMLSLHRSGTNILPSRFSGNCSLSQNLLCQFRCLLCCPSKLVSL